MSLPSVNISIGNGNLGQTNQTADGIVGMVLTGETVAGPGNVTAGESRQVFSLSEAEEMGITSDGSNAFAWKEIKDYYAKAGTGAELWFMLVAAGVSIDAVVDINEDYANKLLLDADGRIRFLVSSIQNAAPTTAGGLDEDVHNAVPLAQALSEAFADRNRPLRILLGGNHYSGTPADLTDYKQDSKNRVAILIGNDDGSNYASVGNFAGRIASTPVQRNPGRVKDGPAVEGDAYFTDGTLAQKSEPAWDAIHDKGYIFFRSFVGRAGFFYTDAPTCTSNADDYNDLPRGLVMDKVHLVAYDTYVDEILEEIPIAEDGTIHPAIIKSWEAKVENAINQQMTGNGEISGVDAYIDPAQPVLQSGEININVKVQPVGYAKKINVPLNFATSLDQ